MNFTIRTTKPSSGNKFYITTTKGGYSRCIQGNPTDKECNVLANCVGYACGRFNEIIGEMKYPTLSCNAENFIEKAKSLGLEISDIPTLGGIMVWQKGSTLNSSDGAGHVAIVERIDNDNQIYTSESSYGGKAFFNSLRTNSNGRWGLGTGYKFLGCIINPAIGDITYNNVSPASQKFAIGDKVVINGILYKSSMASTGSGSVSNKITYITRYVSGAKHPYNTTNDLGWMDEKDISKYEEETNNTQKFTIGAKVIINGSLYKSSNAENPSGSVSNKTTYITRYAKNSKHPYNTTGDLGWMDEKDIKLADNKIYYTVKDGDTLSSIAAKYNMSWKELYAKNKFVIGNNPNIIKVGQELMIK